MPVMYITIKPAITLTTLQIQYFLAEWQINRNVYLSGIWQVRVTPENLNVLEIKSKHNIECTYECHVYVSPWFH